MGLSVTSALSSMIYLKSLKLSTSSIKDYSKWDIVSFQADLKKIASMCE